MQWKRNSPPSANQGLSTVKHSCSPYRAEIKSSQSEVVNFKQPLCWLLHEASAWGLIMLMFWLNASVQNWTKCETPVFVSIHYYSHQRSKVNTPPFLAPHHSRPATRNLLKCSSESVIFLFGAFFLAAPPVLLHDPTLMSSTDGNSPLHALLQLTFLSAPIHIPLHAPSVSSPGSVRSTKC